MAGSVRVEVVRRVSEQINKLRSSISSAIKQHSHNSKEAEKLNDKLFRAKCILRNGNTTTFLPRKNHDGFLKMFLGSINILSVNSQAEKSNFFHL
ncbi:Ion channel TACAN/TMEM120B [Dillenia turbinata]|uniref:Ion channel TACAN/TMEM120B n=1 Tax=Dillenia turbinata TaxID=194707 RepID=A0AAN8Z0J7_9MAGN